MTKFKYNESVIIKSNKKKANIVSVTKSNSSPATYILDNGKELHDEDLSKITNKVNKPKPKRKAKKKSIVPNGIK